MATQLFSRDANGVTFADPTDPDFTVRFKNTKSRKSLNGVSVENSVEEIVINDLVPVTLGNTSANDSVSVRIRISGSAAAHARTKLILKSVAAQLPAWADGNVALGFEPTTAPATPSAT